MKLISMVLLNIYLIIFIGCVKEKPAPAFEDVWVGMTKAEIIKLIGNTGEKRYITKTNNQILGPEKEFWHKIPKGTKLEVWIYHTPKGEINLYFIGKASDLKYKIHVK